MIRGRDKPAALMISGNTQTQATKPRGGKIVIIAHCPVPNGHMGFRTLGMGLYADRVALFFPRDAFCLLLVADLA